MIAAISADGTGLALSVAWAGQSPAKRLIVSQPPDTATHLYPSIGCHGRRLFIRTESQL